MNDIAKSIFVCVVGSVAASYIIREIQTDFWRSQKLYADAKRTVKSKFKRAAA